MTINPKRARGNSLARSSQRTAAFLAVIALLLTASIVETAALVRPTEIEEPAVDPVDSELVEGELITTPGPSREGTAESVEAETEIERLINEAPEEISRRIGSTSLSTDRKNVEIHMFGLIDSDERYFASRWIELVPSNFSSDTMGELTDLVISTLNESEGTPNVVAIEPDPSAGVLTLVLDADINGDAKKQGQVNGLVQAAIANLYGRSESISEWPEQRSDMANLKLEFGFGKTVETEVRDQQLGASGKWVTIDLPPAGTSNNARCTFSWLLKRASTGKYSLLTAGHCSDGQKGSDYLAYNSLIPSQTGTQLYGPVHKNRFNPTSETDSAAVQLDDHTYSDWNALLYVGPTSFRRVERMTAHNNQNIGVQNVCWTGYRTYLDYNVDFRCEELLSKNTTIPKSTVDGSFNIRVNCLQAQQNELPKTGDSGGPVYRVRSDGDVSAWGVNVATISWTTGVWPFQTTHRRACYEPTNHAKAGMGLGFVKHPLS